jgi:hypothetical protein
VDQERAVMLALRHALEADRDRQTKIADLGAELRAARGSRDFPRVLAVVRDSSVVTTAELARLAGLSRSRLYELLEQVDREDER